MSKPVVAIVGRPNVGKSTLFNALAGERISIVQDTPGVTRDRIYAEVSWLDHNFTMIDTGGIEPDSNDIILSQMRSENRMLENHPSSTNWRRRTASLYRISQARPEMQSILILSTMEKNMCLSIPQD